MELNVQAFLKVIDPNDNKTGGGTASSVAGAMAAGLIAMVARLSFDKKGLESKEHYKKIAREGEGLANELFDGCRVDSEAFDKVSEVYKMPKNTQKEKTLRSNAIQRAMIHAARVPLKNAQGCRKVLDLSQLLGKKFNPSAASDFECGVNLANAGLMGCAANVRINLPYIKDEKICRELESSLEELLNTI